MFTANAHILAAANNVSRRNNNICNRPSIDLPVRTYFKVNFRMYIHFNSLRAVAPVEEVYLGSIYAPYKQINIDRITIPAKTCCREYTFSVDSSMCPDGIDNYVKEHIEDFKSSDVWDIYKNKFIREYKEEVMCKYGVLVDNSYLDYNIQYCWDVEV